MTTTTNVQQVKVNKVTQAQYDSMTKNDNEFYVIVDKEYLDGITSADVTTALGYTPYNSTNPAGYITGISSSDVTTVLGYTPANSVDIHTKQYITAIPSSGDIVFNGNSSIYFMAPSAAITLTFPTVALNYTSYTFEIAIDMTGGVYAITWPNNLSWQNGEVPDLSEPGIYFLAFRSIYTGNWLGNLQGKW